MSNRNKFRQATTVLAYLIAAAIFIGYGTLEISRNICDGDFNLVEIEILNPVTANIFAWSASSAFLLLLVLCCVSFKTKWFCWPEIGIAIGLVMYPCSIIWQAVSNLGPWITYGQVVVDDGKTFVFCDSCFLQGQHIAIAEVSERGMFETTYKVLVDTNGDSPRSWASIVRPEGSSDEYGQLYLKNGYLLGVRYENRCYLAYKLENETAYGHGDIESISPFVCLCDGDIPSKKDVQRTCDEINKWVRFCESSDDVRSAESFLAGKFSPGCPDRNELDAEAESPEIASIANSFKDCYEAGKVKLKARLAEQP